MFNKGKTPEGHKRFTIAQEKIINFLKKQPGKTAKNSEIAEALNKRTGHISGTLNILEEKQFIVKTARNVSKYTGKKP